MNNLFDFYKAVEDFANRHRMIDSFKVIGSMDELDTENIKHRSMYVSIESTNISRANNYVSVRLNVFVIDKCFSDDQDSQVLATQENIFVLGELQDYILTLGNDVSFDEIVIAQAPETEYTATAAICEAEILFDRTSYCSSLESFNIEQ